LSPAEQEWRSSLVVGSKVDAIKVDLAYPAKCWAKGFIDAVVSEADEVYVTFENDKPDSRRVFSRWSLELARFDSHSCGDEWRGRL